MFSRDGMYRQIPLGQGWICNALRAFIRETVGDGCESVKITKHTSAPAGSSSHEVSLEDLGLLRDLDRLRLEVFVTASNGAAYSSEIVGARNWIRIDVRGDELDSVQRGLNAISEALNLKFIGTLSSVLEASSEWDYATISKALFVLETWRGTDYKQGTAFAVERYNFVSCAHAVHDSTEAFHPNFPEKSLPVFVKAKNDIIDLAILNISVPDHVKLQLGSSETIHVGDQISIYGYPHYSPTNKNPHLNRGELTGRREVLGQKRLIVGAQITFGNSGGPALDSSSRVIGVAVRGANVEDHSDFNEVVPIEELGKLIG